jgi:hypothetical protein
MGILSRIGIASFLFFILGYQIGDLTENKFYFLFFMMFLVVFGTDDNKRKENK